MIEKGQSKKRVNPNDESELDNPHHFGSPEETQYSASTSKRNRLDIEGAQQEPSTPSLPSRGTPKGIFQFDVFLSFRGKDTRNGFTSHLNEVLKLRGISTFVDSKDLKKGEQIDKLLEYIEKSKICITIISEGYADSKWCLRELAKIVECKEKGKVIPVFFNVDPSDVKKQSGPFASAIERHESNVKLKPEEVKRWREALRQVGNISGYSLGDTHGDEAKLANIIVKEILEKVNPCTTHVGEYVIGHEARLEKLMKAMGGESIDVGMIGIHGMGGIGKTTLAKAVYNEMSSKFEACSFISNVREESQRKGLESLQKQLLRDVFGYEEKYKFITDKDKGIQFIKGHIGVKKVLIILDDVDNKEQLAALAGDRGWFKKGSRIIITTRDVQPLVQHGVKRNGEIYELTGLSHDDSMKLFCYHAFRSEKPRNEYARMCHEAVSSIKGLPLGLKVLGSQFFDLETLEEWRDLLARLKESQHDEIFKKLKLSYDSLSKSDQRVFLDIACFFVGKRKENAWYGDDWEVTDVKDFWKDCGFQPGLAIKVLEHKSLIKIIKRERRPWEPYDWDPMIGKRFEMHDQIRDMGRKIVEEEEKQGSCCSRLWKYDSEVILALRRKEVPTVEGIMFRAAKGADNFSAPCLQEMDRLRLFHVDGLNFEGIPSFPQRLKWLGLPNCRHVQTPTSAVSIPREVTVLDLHRNSNVANVLLEKCRPGITVFNKLKILDLSYTSITITPDFSSIPCLVKLTLKHCRKLVEVHESVGQLKSTLVWLDLEGCKQLEKIPDTICELKFTRIPLSQ